MVSCKHGKGRTSGWPAASQRRDNKSVMVALRGLQLGKCVTWDVEDPNGSGRWVTESFSRLKEQQEIQSNAHLKVSCWPSLLNRPSSFLSSLSMLASSCSPLSVPLPVSSSALCKTLPCRLDLWAAPWRPINANLLAPLESLARSSKARKQLWRTSSPSFAPLLRK